MPSVLSTFRHIHGKTLADEVDEIAVSSGAMKLEGFVSLRGLRTKAHQYIYINRHPLSPSHHLHRNIHHAFSNSSFSKRVLCADATNPSRQRTRRSPHKLDLKPIYVLSLTVPPQDIDNCLEPGKSSIHVSNEDAITAFFDSVINGFLLRHSFLVNDEVRPTQQKRRRKITGEGDSSKSDSGLPASPQTSCQGRAPFNRRNIQTINHDGGNVPPLYVNPNDDNDNDDGIVWIDPSSGVTFVVDKRTGHSYPHTPLSRHFDEDNVQGVHLTRRTIAVTDSGDREEEPPQWIVDALKDNSAYFIKERPIPSVSQRLPNPLSLSSKHVVPTTCATHTVRLIHRSLSISDETSTWCLQKDDLARMKVINQLDRKFIICAVDENGGIDDSGQAFDRPRRMLVLVDQHAASERVRVEGFLRTLCHDFLDLGSNESQNADRVKLDPPHPILLSRKEASRLRETRSILARWCFDLSWPEPEGCDQIINQDAHEQFLVHSIPHVVSEKLLAGDGLRDFLKEYAAEAETDDTLPALGSGSESRGDDRDHLTWHKALRWCPKALLELVNSKACRGAIMFNDPLSIEQCVRLIIQLSETAFPFQCAHGRPSLVPLAGMPEYPRRQDQRRNVDWMRSGPMLASLSEVESSDG